MMEEFSQSASSKKRKAKDKNCLDSAEVKRSRTGCVADIDNAVSLTSAEAMLAVPMSVVFREVASGKSKRPLLSRSEAQCILHVNFLAASLDSLTEVSQNSINQRLQCGEFLNNLRGTDHPYLRPLLVTLHTLGTLVPEASLSFVRNELATTEGELCRTAASIRQCSEQNWTLAETLQDCAYALSQEKRKLSDIQEEICRRIDILVGSTVEENADSSPMIPMTEYCTRLMSSTAQQKEPECLGPPQIATTGNKSSSSNMSKEDGQDGRSEEILQVATPAPSKDCSQLTTPPDSPEAPELSEPEDTNAVDSETKKTSTPSTTAPTFQPHRLSAARTSSTRQHTPSTCATKEPRPEGFEEKENAPSQSSSQHSSQTTPLGVLAAEAESSSPSCFQSQAAAEVLSAMAATSRTASAWRGEHSSEGK